MALDFSSQYRAIMIVDTDGPALETLKTDPLVQQFPLILVSDPKRAQGFLAEKTRPLLGLFVNPESVEPMGLSIIRSAHFHRPGLRSFLVKRKEFELQLTPQELRAIGVHEVLNRPISLREMVSRLSPLSLDFNALTALEKSRAQGDRIDQEVAAEAGTFIAISARDFLSGSTSFFDVYVRLGATKFVKLIQAGDSFSVSRLESYIKKGVFHFYIRKEVQEDYVAYCDKLTSTLLSRSGVSTDLRASQTLNQGEQVLTLLAQNGVDQNNLNHAVNFVANVRKLIQTEKLDQQESVQALLKNAALYEHSVGTTLLSAILANTLEVAHENPLQMIGLSSTFPDLSLAFQPGAKLSEALASEDVSRMSPEEEKLFKQHPQKSAEMVRDLPGLANASGIIQAIQQHHMRPNNQSGRGFPAREFGMSINRVGEMVGICGEFQRWIEKDALAKKAGRPLNLLFELEQDLFPEYSRQIVYAFRTAFFPRKIT